MTTNNQEEEEEEEEERLVMPKEYGDSDGFWIYLPTKVFDQLPEGVRRPDAQVLLGRGAAHELVDMIKAGLGSGRVVLWEELLAPTPRHD
jgi:hypothetical protein